MYQALFFSSLEQKKQRSKKKNAWSQVSMYMNPLTTDKLKLPFFAAFHHLDFLGSRHSFYTLLICDRKDCQSRTMVTEHWKASVNGRDGLQKTNPVWIQAMMEQYY